MNLQCDQQSNNKQ